MLTRNRVAEIMDDPNLDGTAHANALTAITRLNRISGADASIWREILNLEKKNKNKTIRILDIATGAADGPISLLNRAAAANVKLQVDACDISKQGLDDARQRASAANVQINFFEFDVLNDVLPKGYDVITTSLFTHHLDPSQVVPLLAGMKTATNSLVLVDDLERSFLNLIMVSIATYSLTTSPVARHDGPASVKAAYTRSEMLQMAESAGLSGAKTYLHFPCRFLLRWAKDGT